MKFEPKCMSGRKVFAHSAEGWLLPCSWVDPNQNIPNEELTSNLFKEELKLENVDSIEDILFSDEWVEFIKVLEEGDIDKIPSPCKKYCVNSSEHKEKIFF